MTIKTRNRLNTAIFIFSLLVFIVNVAVFVYRAINYSVFENIYYTGESKHTNIIANFLFDYHPMAVYISLFFMSFYVWITFLLMAHAFEKTQNTEICFFSCYLIACLAETSRLYIPIFEVGETSSTLLIVLGNFSAFARILAPLSFLFSVIMSGQEQRQNLERNLMLILVSAIFFAVIIPLNTSVIEPTFRVHIGFDRTVVLIEILIDVSAVISLVVLNVRNRLSQKTAIGMTMIISGFVLSVNGTNYLKMILSVFFLSAGTYLYLKELHNQHLYD